MKDLGKIVLWCMMVLPLMADLQVSVDKENVTLGERVTFTLRVTGTGTLDIPDLTELCGATIEGRMQSQKSVISNGTLQREISLMYEFMPQRSCVIEPFKVSVNGADEMTEAINISVSKLSIQKGDPFIVGLMTHKKSVYVGEPFEMRVDFKERQNMDALAESISLPENKNLWVKSEQKGKPYIKERYKNRTNWYALSAQQSGKLNLGPLRWDLKVRSQGRDIWGTWMASSKTHTVFSNELDIEVKALPEGITLVGDLQIEAKVDKTEVNKGDAVNVSITVKGRANVEDIPDFSIHVEDAQVFTEGAKVSHYLEEGSYYGTFTQKSAIVAGKDFEIPAFSLRYMDPQSDTIKTISTDVIRVKVIGSPVSDEEELKVVRPEIREDVEQPVESSFGGSEGVLLFLAGLFFGVLFAFIPWKKMLKMLKMRKQGDKKVPASVSKELLQLLIAHMEHDREIEDLVKALSENLYEGASHPIDKRYLQKIILRVQKKESFRGGN